MLDFVDAGPVRLAAEAIGDPDDPALVLVSGQGSQLTNWPDELCAAFTDRGFRVIRFDNRDVGLSTILPAGSTYTLSDMAADAATVIEHFDAAPAHVVGISMGGMIAQVLAAEHPHLVASLTSLASTTGNPDVGEATDEALELLVRVAHDRDDVIANAVAGKRHWGTRDEWDEDEFAAFIGSNFDRAHHPDGALRQLEAIAASGDRDDQLLTIAVPTLVIHGDADTLLGPSGGRRTAELIDGAEYVEVEGLGHDVPTPFWPRFVEMVTQLAARAHAEGRA